MESSDLDASQLPIFASIAPAALLKISGHLDIDVDESMKQKLTENPLLEVAMIDAPTLVASTSNVSSDDDAELEEHITNSIPPQYAELVKLLIKHVGDNIHFSLVDRNIGLKGRLSGEGLNLIAKTGLKYLS